MQKPRSIFLSAVSKEFHLAPPGKSHRFASYRDVLERAFRTLAPHYEVIVQETLPAGVGDLLETLDSEIARSLMIIHLVGETAGSSPQSAEVQNLRYRHQAFLKNQPALMQAIFRNTSDISYTQWELYLAIHYNLKRLVFEAEPRAPRSPHFVASKSDTASQNAHLERIMLTGQHRSTFCDQGDVARKTMRAFLHFRADPTTDAVVPDADSLAAAWDQEHLIIAQLVSAIKRPDPKAVPVTDPSNVAAFVAAVRAAAEKWHVDLATIVDIAARHEQRVRAEAEDNPTTGALHDVAFANFALGDYSAAQFWARRATDQALELIQAQNERFDEIAQLRASALNALLLLHEAAKATHDMPGTISALQEASLLADKDADPLLWADINEDLAASILWDAQFKKAADLISDVLDIREEFQGETNPALAKTLLLWGALLTDQANYPGAASVAQRAEDIFAKQLPPDVMGIAAALSTRGMALASNYRIAEAEPLVRGALKIREASFGPEHPRVAETLNNLGVVLINTNRIAEAEPLLRRALKIREASFGPEHPTVAETLNNLGVVLINTNRIAEGEPLLRRALEIREASFGPEHPRVAETLNNLGAVLNNTNRIAEGEPLLRRALEIREASFGPEHPTVAETLNNLGVVLINANRIAEAEPLVRRALKIREASFGPEHPTVAETLNNLGVVLINTNRIAEAEPLLRRALEIREASFGPEHPTVAETLNNLGDVLINTNRIAEGEPLLRRALEIREASFGPEHPRVAETLNNLGAVLNNTNRIAEGEPLLRRALKIREASFGPEHPRVAETLNNLGVVLITANHIAEGEPLLRRALKIREASFGPEHPTVAETLNNLGVVLINTNRIAEGEPLLRRALEIREASFGPEHPTVAETLNNLGVVLINANRIAEGEPLLRRALEIREASFGPEHPTVVETLNNLGVVLAVNNRIAEAELAATMRRVSSSVTTLQ